MTETELLALQESLNWATTVNMEVFYWWCTALMFIIHAGFLGYEMGASRKKNVLASGMKNILAFAFVIPTFYFIGWWLYLASPNGLPDVTAETGGAPWSLAMGPNLTDNASGIFWAAFTLFAATTASIFSGAVIERIKMSGFIILAVLLGSVVWIIGAAWAWHGDGWLLTQYGWHDFGAAGCVHMVAGFFAFGVLSIFGHALPWGLMLAVALHVTLWFETQWVIIAVFVGVMQIWDWISAKCDQTAVRALHAVGLTAEDQAENGSS